MKKVVSAALAVLVMCSATAGLSADRVRIESSGVITQAGYPVKNAEVELWAFEGNGAMRTPVVGSGGTIYASTESGMLYALDNEGSMKWRVPTYTNLTSPVLDANGKLWFGGANARLLQFDQAGKGGETHIAYFEGKKNGQLPSVPELDSEGNGYFAYGSRLLAFDPQGKSIWTYALPHGAEYRGVALGSNDTIYVSGMTSERGYVFAVDTAGRLVWEYEIGGTSPLQSMNPVIAKDGTVYVLTGEKLLALKADGTLVWEREAPYASRTLTTPAVGKDGTLYVTAAGGGLTAIQGGDGSVKWSAGGSGSQQFVASPVIDSAGIVYIATTDGQLAGYDASGKLVYTYKGSAGKITGNLAVTADGKLLYGTADGKLHAIGPRKTVQVQLPAKEERVEVGDTYFVTDKMKLSADVPVSFTSSNPKVAKVDVTGKITTISEGKVDITVKVMDNLYRGSGVLRLNVAKPQPPVLAFQPRAASQKVTVGGRTFSVQTVLIPKGMPVTAGLADRKVGKVADLSSIAKAYNADIAINGTFFEAYGGIPEPWGTVITQGQVAHVGNVGSAVGFTRDGQVLFDTLRVKIEGGANGSYSWPNNWYAYFVNRTPSQTGNAAILFTPHRGAKLGFAYGTSVVVKGGKVIKIVKNEDVAIPADGFVLNLTGSERVLADRFKVGGEAEYRLRYENKDRKALDWSKVQTAFGAGPRLVKDGKKAVDPKAEGFTETKILSSGAGRSAIAVKKDGSILLATVSGATIDQWAQVMVKLGAYQAINLDGGASSGLYFQGKTVTKPGRLVSNAIVFGTKLNK